MLGRYFSILWILFVITACNKDKIRLYGGDPSLQVTTAATSYKAGQEVVFSLSGKADVISFYSGEPFREYLYKDGRTVQVSEPKMSFFSAVQGGVQAGQLKVLASTDFNGVYYDSLKAPLTDVHAATWIDISSRFKWGASVSFATSETKDISDLLVPGKPLYIAFKYTTSPQTANGAARTWMVQSFSLTASSSVGIITLSDLPNAGFRIVHDHPATAPSQSVVSASRITFLANAFSPDNDPATENWAITKAIDAGTFNSGPDRPVGIKAMSNPTLETYNYKYTKPGTYKVHFIGVNANVNEKREVVIPLELTIEP